MFDILKRNYKSWKAPVVEFQKVKGKEPFRVLISALLSTRTKDETTVKAVKRLFDRVKTPEDLASMSESQIAELIYPVGFYRQKAKFLKQMSKQIVEEFSGKVPNNMKELLKLKGVGRKVANLVLSKAFGKQAICVDTHVHRIANRIGLVKTKTPEQTEVELMKVLPKKYWSQVNELFVALGQTICKPLKPECQRCPIKKFCKSAGGK